MMSLPTNSEIVGIQNMTDDNIGELRNAMNEYMGPKFSTPGWKKYVNNCIQTQSEFVDPETGNTIKLFFAMKMTNIGKKLPLCINAHGGGCCVGTANDESAFICKLAD